MEIARYLAMTADEFAHAEARPDRVAWMACHFSPYSTSLSNLPSDLPAGSLLILNDSTPPSGQTSENVAKVLEIIVKRFHCFGLLLDFQRKGHPQCSALAKELIALDCPVCVSELYAAELDCPVFLPPLPLTTPLREYIQPWTNREIWLDIALSCQQFTVTKEGYKSIPLAQPPDCQLKDKILHCHYHTAQTDDSFVFTLQRTKDDLNDLLEEAQNLGITTAVGLYQELK